MKSSGRWVFNEKGNDTTYSVQVRTTLASSPGFMIDVGAYPFVACNEGNYGVGRALAGCGRGRDRGRLAGVFAVDEHLA